MNKKIFIFCLLLLLICGIGIHYGPKTCTRKFFNYVSTYWTDNIELWKAIWNNKSKEVSAITASSPWLVDEVCKRFIESKNKNQEGQRILEVGFGPGTITRKLIEEMNPADSLDAVELVESMYDTAKKNLPTANNVHLFNANFTKWLPEGITNINTITKNLQYDFIISTIPFTQLPDAVMKPILNKISLLLKQGGTFTYISLIGADFASRTIRWGKEYEQYEKKMKFFAEWVHKHFHTIEEKPTPSDRETVILNITPAWVIHLVKK